MTARPIRGAWWVDFRWKHLQGPKAGQVERLRLKSPIDTKRGAEEHERQLRTRLMSALPLTDEVVATPTLAEHMQEWLATYCKSNNKASTLDSKESVVRIHLEPLFGHMKVDEISMRDIERFKANKVAAGLHPKTINNLLSVLRSALACAVEWGHMEYVPAIKWMKAPAPSFDFFDAAESERLIAAATPEDLPILMTALRTGLRRGELMALRWEDVDFVAGNILVRRSAWRGTIGTPKSGKGREVPMTRDLVRILKKYRHLRPLVFSNPDGSMLGRDQMKHVVPRTCRKAGLRELQWHALRHSFASQLVMRNIPLKAVQELLGHATIEMTMRYAHLSPSVHRDAVAVLDAPESGHYLGTGTAAKF